MRRPVATARFCLGVGILGVISPARLSVDWLPDLSYPRLTVWTSYPDVPPIEVEELVTVPVEEAVSTIPRVRRVSSLTKEGVSLVTLAFLRSTNMLGAFPFVSFFCHTHTNPNHLLIGFRLNQIEIIKIVNCYQFL